MNAAAEKRVDLLRIWCMEEPFESRYAAASLAAEWNRQSAEGAQPNERMEIEFEPSSQQIGSFIWPALSLELVTLGSIANDLKSRFTGFWLVNVEVTSTRKRKPIKRTVPYPYCGPTLAAIWITKWVEFNESISTVLRSDEPGRPRLEIVGAEAREINFDKYKGQSVVKHKPRLPNHGIFIEQASVEGADFFHVRQYSGALFCTDRVRDFVLGEGYTNICFLEMGELYVN